MAETKTKSAFLKEIWTAKSKKDYDSMLVLSKDALLAYPENFLFIYFLHSAQAHYINQKLKTDLVKQLQVKKDYVSLSMIYQKLLMIFPESKKLHKLLSDVKNLLEEQSRNEKSEYFKKSETQIVEFIQQKDYSSAFSSVYQVLNSDPKNKTFINLENRIQKDLNSEIDKDLDSYFIKNTTLLKQEYTQHKEDFILV